MDMCSFTVWTCVVLLYGHVSVIVWTYVVLLYGHV